MKRHLVLAALSASAAVATVTFTSASASAQTTSPAANGFGVNHFETSERGSEWFALDSLDLKGHLRPAFGIVGEWAYRPLVLTNTNGDTVRSIVRDQAFLHVGGSLVLWDRLRLAADLPILVANDGHEGVGNGVTYPAPVHSAGVGDLRLGADLRVFGEHGDAITGAIGAQVSLPTGTRDSYAGDGSTRISPHALIAGDVGIFTYAAKAGVTVRTIQETYDSGQIGTELDFGGAVGLRLADRKLVIGPEVFGRSVFVNDGFFKKKSTPVEGLIGAHYTFCDQFRGGAGVSTGFTEGYGTPEFRGLLSVEWVPGAHAPTDRDGDGILDKDDACPDTPGVGSADPAKNGCPLPLAAPPRADRDGDGVLDTDDACPDVAGVKTDDPKTNGCPSDRDHDGILDDADACPDTPGVKTDDPKTNGCPADTDRDKDGIPNDKDACPDEPGKPDPDPARNGCPKAFVKDGKIRILDQVKFKTGSAQILPGPDSEGVLLAVADVLGKHPEIKAIEVEGHTDNRGNAAANKKLSAARAAAVKKWLEGHGIDASRMTSEGYGQDKPIDSNETEAGRKNNRRVEFRIKS